MPFAVHLPEFAYLKLPRQEFAADNFQNFQSVYLLSGGQEPLLSGLPKSHLTSQPFITLPLRFIEPLEVHWLGLELDWLFPKVKGLMISSVLLFGWCLLWLENNLHFVVKETVVMLVLIKNRWHLLSKRQRLREKTFPKMFRIEIKWHSVSKIQWLWETRWRMWSPNTRMYPCGALLAFGVYLGVSLTSCLTVSAVAFARWRRHLRPFFNVPIDNKTQNTKTSNTFGKPTCGVAVCTYHHGA